MYIPKEEFEKCGLLEPKPVQVNTPLEELQDEIERLDRELKQTEAQDQVVIDNLRKENAKMKCWALHLSENYFIAWAAYLFKLHKRKRAKRIENLSEKYGIAYRKAKKALREGK